MASDKLNFAPDPQMETLLQSYRNLEEAKQKFRESLDAVKTQRDLSADKTILVPMTGSMYVPGYLEDPNEFLIDIGTQYLVKRNGTQTQEYFERKIAFIDTQIKKFKDFMAPPSKPNKGPSSSK